MKPVDDDTARAVRATADELADDELRALRLRAQNLAADSGSLDVASLLSRILGVQAQYMDAALLAVSARLPRIELDAIERARVDDRSIVRTWSMRGTLQLVAARDYAWLQALHGQYFIHRTQHRYHALGLTADVCARANEQLKIELSAGHAMTRAQLTAEFAKRGLPAAGQAPYHLLRRAALEGLVCFGPDQGRKPTFVLTESWLGRRPAIGSETALAELSRRYLEAFGPATLADLSAWSGLSTGMLRAVWPSAGTPQIYVKEHRGETLTGLGPTAGVHDYVRVRLVPAYDPYLLGYRSRELIVEPGFEKRVHPGGGLLNAVVLIDGVAQGTWNIHKAREQSELRVQPFRSFAADDWSAIELEVQRIAAFLRIPLRLRRSSLRH